MPCPLRTPPSSHLVAERRRPRRAIAGSPAPECVRFADLPVDRSALWVRSDGYACLRCHLIAGGHDTVHTLELPEQNRTTDAEISRIADAAERIVVSKDSDFRASHMLNGTPARLLIVSTGNITNRQLLALFDQHIDAVVAAFEGARLVQLSANDLSVLDED